VHVITPRAINELSRTQVIVLFSNRKPMWLTRMDWQEHPVLRQRRAMPPPPVAPLPSLTPIPLPSPTTPADADDDLWNPDNLN
jgi:type IV secretory pathway TraG/TraD family ATPase VirD4